MINKRAHIDSALFYGSLLLAFFGLFMELFATEHPFWAYLTGSGLGAAVTSAWGMQKPQAYSAEEMSDAVRRAEQSGFDEGVRFALEWEEHYVRGAKPLTQDHIFGEYTLTLKPRRNIKKKSSENPEKRLRAIQAEGRLRCLGITDA
jgi:hypothetical protein